MIHCFKPGDQNEHRMILWVFVAAAVLQVCVGNIGPGIGAAHSHTSHSAVGAPFGVGGFGFGGPFLGHGGIGFGIGGHGLENPVCYYPPSKGACYGVYPRWYFDPYTGYCRLFFWSGCGGNYNRFLTSHECQYECAVGHHGHIHDPHLGHGVGHGFGHGIGHGFGHGIGGHGIDHGFGHGIPHGIGHGFGGHGIDHGFGHGIPHGIGHGFGHGIPHGIGHGFGHGIPHGIGHGFGHGIGGHGFDHGFGHGFGPGIGYGVGGAAVTEHHQVQHTPFGSASTSHQSVDAAPFGLGPYGKK